ncbi:MAG TPA: sugar MFS transporter [Terracidiphilus sp.]|jgi:FHS family L-fucose permease-like MFS transporter
MATRSNPAATTAAPSYTGPFITVAILFGIFGFLTVLNNTLVKKLEDIFQLGYGLAMLATAAWFFAYLVFSVPWAKVIEAVGYKRTMVISLFVMVMGALLFVPAANAVSFPMTLFAIFVLASGVCGLQTSANPYVSILGPEHSASARLNLAQAVNSFGSLVAPWVAARFILSETNSAATSAATAHMLEGPYIAIAIALLVLGFAVMMLHLPAITMAPESQTSSGEGTQKNIWTHRHTVLGMVGIFVYVGLEISLAAICIQFCLKQGIEPVESWFNLHVFNHGIFVGLFGLQGGISDVETAGLMLTLYYTSMMIGRLVGSAVMKWIKSQHLLVLLGLAGTLLLLASMFSHGLFAVWALVFCGLTNSIMYPTIFALGVAELGPLTSKGSGVLTIGNVGGAVIPPLFGVLADRVGIQYALVVPIVAYLYVAYYGLSGYKPERKTAA